MSGFLHRIATQAMGRESTLHSVARLPYAIPPLTVHNKEPSGQITELATNTNKRRPIIANNGAEPGHVPIQNQMHDSNRVESGTQAFENEALPASPEILIAQSVTEFITKPDFEIVPPSSVKSRLRQAEKNEKNTAAGESSVWNEAIKTHTPSNNSPTKSGTNGKIYPNLTDNTIPPLLLPSNNAVHPSALNSNKVAQLGEPRSSSWQSQIEETTEVHVSIGRIEVTAVHEAPPPKRQATVAAKPMTLDEYLARKRREA
jgi:hypothetical protein